MADAVSVETTNRALTPILGIAGVRLEGIVCLLTLQRLLLEPFAIVWHRFGVADLFGVSER